MNSGMFKHRKMRFFNFLCRNLIFSYFSISGQNEIILAKFRGGGLLFSEQFGASPKIRSKVWVPPKVEGENSQMGYGNGLGLLRGTF